MSVELEMPVTIARALELVTDIAWHNSYGEQWELHCTIVNEHNEAIKARHTQALAEHMLSIPPCPIDISQPVEIGSDEEWEYKQWIESSKFPAPELVSPWAFPPDVQAQLDLQMKEPQLSQLLTSPTTMLPYLLDVERWLSERIDEQSAEIQQEFMGDLRRNFLRSAPKMLPDAWKVYQQETEAAADAQYRAQQGADIAERVERTVAQLVRDTAEFDTGTLPLKVSGFNDMADIMSSLDMIAESVKLIRAQIPSYMQVTGSVITREDKAVLTLMVRRFYKANVAQTKQMEVILACLAAGKIDGMEISNLAGVMVHNWFMTVVNDSSFSNARLGMWLKDTRGSALYAEVCRRYNIAAQSVDKLAML